MPVRTAAELESVSALVIPGGESTTMGRLLTLFELEKPLLRRLDAGMPTMSTCAGLILLSRTVLDGRPGQLATGTLDVAVRRNGWGGQLDSFEADVAIGGIGDRPFPAVFIRAPRLETTGAAVDVVARLDGEPVAIVQGPHLGLAFHPEMSGDDRVHRLFLERLERDRGESAA